MSNEEIKKYREEVYAAMVALPGKDGQPKLSEKEARDILKTFTDEEIADGMPFNTPQEVAELLAEP